MPDLVSSPSSNVATLSNSISTPYSDSILDFQLLPSIPAGTLRIGGDSPSGLVLAGGAPAARIVDLFAREVLDNNKVAVVHVARTVSDSSGQYSFTNLATRPQGYDVIIRGIVANGERDVIIPGVNPI